MKTRNCRSCREIFVHDEKRSGEGFAGLVLLLDKQGDGENRVGKRGKEDSFFLTKKEKYMSRRLIVPESPLGVDEDKKRIAIASF